MKIILPILILLVALSWAWIINSQPDPTPKTDIAIPTRFHEGFGTQRVDIGGVDCVVVYHTYQAESVAISCNWQQP